MKYAFLAGLVAGVAVHRRWERATRRVRAARAAYRGLD
jgi:hypothetical protein